MAGYSLALEVVSFTGGRSPPNPPQDLHDAVVGAFAMPMPVAGRIATVGDWSCRIAASDGHLGYGSIPLTITYTVTALNLGIPADMIQAGYFADAFAWPEGESFIVLERQFGHNVEMPETITWRAVVTIEEDPPEWEPPLQLPRSFPTAFKRPFARQWR